jgi:TRAM domain
VPEVVREARRDELVSLQQDIGQAWAEASVGQEVGRPCLCARTVYHLVGQACYRLLSSSSMTGCHNAFPLRIIQQQLPLGFMASACQTHQLTGIARHCNPYIVQHLVQVDVLVDSISEDGEFIGRTQWDAPDVDPIVFLSQPSDPSTPALEVGQMRRCIIDGSSLFDLEAHPID